MERRVDNSRAIAMGTVAGVALVATLFWFIHREETTPSLPLAPPPAAAPGPDTDADGAAAPESAYPIPQTPPGAPPLPDLDGSDEAVIASLQESFGTPPIEAFLLPKDVLQRFVIFVDNLDRAALPLRFWPVAHTKGAFVADSAGGSLTPGAKNPSRYEPFIVALEAADPQKLATVYFRYYPLMQEAYKQVGYPDRQFNDRFIAILDHLLDAPEPAEPVALVRPKVLYEFADPELEKLSWGQKSMVRMGPANEARVKARLELIRAAITAPGKPPAR